ncbi:MAG: family HAD-type hydrolase [Alphaproteobacteria bacterium]|jgi:HAD superfamily hydrolase (TIGR01459 family)|nr:family HAD-type hydrolase [Alphaproteobacteria bacterium]
MASHFISGIKDVVDQYDAFIIDLWGVIHDGRKPYPCAVETLKNLKSLKKTTLLLSNSPRRVFASEEHLANMGLSRDLYTHIYTSGEDTYRGLKNRPDTWHQKLGNRLYHIGPEFHQPLYTSLDYEKTSSPEDADFLLATGADFPHIQDYEGVLKNGIDHDLPMLCANPDRVVVQDGQIILCCGGIAERYEQLGGNVFYHGKPFPAVYQPVLSLLGNIPPSRILAIGDSLTTDIKGAQSNDIDGVLIMGGIHHEDLLPAGEMTPPTPQLLQDLSAKTGITPAYALPEMRWDN